MPQEKFLTNMDKYGNTSAASIPILLDEAVSSGKITLGKQQKVIFTGYGGGLTWGSISWSCKLLNYKNKKQTISEEYIIMVFEKIQEIIAEELGKETEEIKLTTDIQEDLEADSLDLFQIINEIEDEFDVKIETEDGIKTVQDLVTYVEKQTA